MLTKVVGGGYYFSYMKSLKLILGLALGTTGLGSTIAFGVANNVVQQNSVAPAEAATTDKVIYIDFDLNSKFKESGANPWVRYWNGSQNYVQLNHVSNNIYRTASAIPAAVLTNGSYGFEAYCFNQADKKNDCTTTWISGNGYLQNPNYNYLCVGTYTSGQQNQIKGFGYYGNDTTNPGASAATQRVWLKNDTPYFYGNDDWGTQCKNVIGYIYNSTWTTIEMCDHLNNADSNYYFYADIPVGVTDVHFLRCSRKANHKYLYYLDAYIETLEYGKCYFSGTNNYNDFVNMTTKAVNYADAYLLKAVVESYLTCKTTGSNGSSATNVANIKSTWFDNRAPDGINGNIHELTLNDYANGDTSYIGSKTKSVTVYEKWTAMGGEAIGSNVINRINNNSTIVVITAVSASVAMLSVGLFFFIKKKHI